MTKKPSKWDYRRHSPECRKSLDEVSKKSRQSVEKVSIECRKSADEAPTKCRKSLDEVSKSLDEVPKSVKKRQKVSECVKKCQESVKKSVNPASNCARPNFSNRDFRVAFRAFFWNYTFGTIGHYKPWPHIFLGKLTPKKIHKVCAVGGGGHDDVVIAHRQNHGLTKAGFHIPDMTIMTLHDALWRFMTFYDVLWRFMVLPLSNEDSDGNYIKNGPKCRIVSQQVIKYRK